MLETFSLERVLAQDVKVVMKRTKIEADPEYDRVYPKGIPNKVKVRLKDGRGGSHISSRAFHEPTNG